MASTPTPREGLAGRSGPGRDGPEMPPEDRRASERTIRDHYDVVATLHHTIKMHERGGGPEALELPKHRAFQRS